VFGGMILASFIGIFAIPPLYVSFQWIREKLKQALQPKTAQSQIGETKLSPQSKPTQPKPPVAAE
jgi:hypothetical protein